MKKVDIIVCFALAVLSAILAVVVTRAIFGEPEKATAIIEQVEAIPAGVTQPDPLIFNNKAIDPTIEVCIGDMNQGSEISQEDCYGQFEVVDPTCDPEENPACVLPEEEDDEETTPSTNTSGGR
ncbi:MAG: hypothetical protein LBM12_00590 [Candidatus Nomurabacteria bacterium]|jgi:hypothetical protein|nr:hypothetical protein [Candidatus Nomurabacteria bacterium]